MGQRRTLTRRGHGDLTGITSPAIFLGEETEPSARNSGGASR